MLALAVVFVWGTNFVVIKYALHDMPPLLFAALRFTLVVFPAIFSLNARLSRGAISPPMAC